MALPLIQSEVPLREVRGHWIAMVRRMAWAILILVVVVLVDIVSTPLKGGEVRVVVTLGGVAIVGLLAMFAYYEWRADLLVITNKRLISHRGIGHRTIKMFMLDNVMYVYVKQTGMGRLMDYARVEVVAPGGKGEEVLERAPRPHELCAEIMELSRAKS
jgi:uncharacterized membrane protein YdbT with pleckstrin-like domain